MSTRTIPFRSSLTQDDVMNQTRVLLEDFIPNRMRNDGIVNPPQVADLEQPRGPPIGHAQELGRLMQRKADELDGDSRLQRAIDETPPDAKRETFNEVLSTMFSDGKYTWGRIIMVFYLGYKLSVKALASRPSLIRSIIGHIISFIATGIAEWIFKHGGWESILDHFSSARNWKIVAGAGIAGAALGVFYFVWK